MVYSWDSVPSVIQMGSLRWLSACEESCSRIHRRDRLTVVRSHLVALGPLRHRFRWASDAAARPFIART